MTGICCGCSWDFRPVFDQTGPIGCAGSWFKMTFPFLSPLLCSTLPDSPPDSGSEAYSPQQVNGKCLKVCGGGGIIIQTQHPPPLCSVQVVGSEIFIRREKTGGCNTWGDYQLVNIPRLSPIVLLVVFARGESKREREQERRQGGNPLAQGEIGGVACPWAGWDVKPASLLVLPSASGERKARSVSASLKWSPAWGDRNEPAAQQ